VVVCFESAFIATIVHCRSRTTNAQW
jgi:hypothetical protein